MNVSENHWKELPLWLSELTGLTQLVLEASVPVLNLPPTATHLDDDAPGGRPP